MSKSINQLCSNIANHPSNINQLNDVILMAIQNRHPQQFEPIVQLLQKLNIHEGLRSFISVKAQAVFLALLSIFLDNHDDFTLKLLSKSFDIANQSQKYILVQELLEQTSQKGLEAIFEWPGNILVYVIDHLSNSIQQSLTINWQQIIDILINLPHFDQIQLSVEAQPIFKKRFQKLLLGVLGHQSVSRQHLYELYHHLGQKILSKLTNPLALANHCISRFAEDPELQIQILACLFVLVGKYGLELQQFYPKLQKLVKYRQKSRSIYELPNSRRFFKLLQAALRSSRVPFKTVAVFAQLLIKQLPGQQSQFAFWSLSFIVNLTKKHRKLLDELPQMPQVKLLKYHYSSKIRALVQQLFKNLNKSDYLQIEEFGKIDCGELADKKLASVMQSLQEEGLQFKIPVFQDPL